jgi:hypothetical protein
MPPKVIGKKIGQVTRAPSGVGTSRPRKVGKTVQTHIGRGEKQVTKRDHSKTATPKGYGGAPTIDKRANAQKRKGGGRNVGVGAITGVDV